MHFAYKRSTRMKLNLIKFDVFSLIFYRLTINEMCEADSSLSQDEKSLFVLLDKFIKSPINNSLPLQAYLQYLENDNAEIFSTICYVKPAHTQHVSISSESSIGGTYPSKGSNSQDASIHNSLCAIHNSLNPHLPSRPNDLILAQRLYKIIISIDYSPQTTNVDFIRKSLDKLFEKISIEYGEFYEKCSFLEPQIYVTVLLWNSALFEYRYSNVTRSSNNINGEFIENNEHFMPFTIICHAKRLLKSNLSEISSYLFDKINETKETFLKSFKQRNEMPKKEEDHEPYSNNHPNSTFNKEFGTLELLLAHVLKVFAFFSVNEYAILNSAPTALSLPHHIYVTDGLIYAQNMIKCLEKMSKSGISFSFINSSNSDYESGIYSGFGYVADHHLMKFIAKITNGFYAVFDENLNYLEVQPKKILYYFDLSASDEKMESHKSLNSSFIDEVSEAENRPESKLTEDPGNGETIDEFEKFETKRSKPNLKIQTQFIVGPFPSNSNSSKSHRKLNLESKKQIVTKSSSEQLPDTKLVQKYEISKNHSIHQIVRFRSQEGFNLVKITKQQVKQGASKLNSPSKRALKVYQVTKNNI